jgi:hypothetical protein
MNLSEHNSVHSSWQNQFEAGFLASTKGDWASNMVPKLDNHGQARSWELEQSASVDPSEESQASLPGTSCVSVLSLDLQGHKGDLALLLCLHPWRSLWKQ